MSSSCRKSGLLIQAFKGLGLLQVSGTVLGRDRDERISTCMKCQKALGNKAILHFMRYHPDVYDLISRLLSVWGLIDSDIAQKKIELSRAGWSLPSRSG